MTTIVYTSTNTDLQVIDTFVLPTEKTVFYDIHSSDVDNTSMSSVVVNHNGIQTSETQTTFALSGTRPAEFVTTIANNVGKLSVTPDKSHTTYTIDRTVIESTLYGENTLSGRNIKTAKGMGLYLTGNANNMIIRLSNNNFYGNSNTYVTAGVLGTVMTGSELFSANNLISYNDSVVSGNLVITSSGQSKSHSYVLLAVTPGLTYRVSANASYSFAEVRGATDSRDIKTKIVVGSELASDNIVSNELSQANTAYNVDFVATANSVYVGFGFGALGSVLNLSNVSIKEIVPFHTYNQLQGAVYVKWNSVAAGSNVVSIGNNTIAIHSSNNVIINTVNCGSQQAVNMLAYNYSLTEIKYSFNGAAPITQSATVYSNAKQMNIQSTIEEFGYMSEPVSNTVLTSLTND